MTRHGRRLLGVTPMLALLVLAGCGTGGGGSVAAADDERGQARRFAACMRDHGIDLPDPEPGGSGASQAGVRLDDKIDPSRLAAAHKACEQHSPGLSGGGPRPDAERLAEMRRFAKCMRDHGIEGFLDPSPDGNNQMVIIGEGGVDPNDPAFLAADRACQASGSKAGPAQPGNSR